MAFNYNYDSDKGHALYKILKPVATIVSNTKYKINYIGAENVPKNKGIILASNHMTNLDPVIIGSGCQTPLYFMAKQELFEKQAVGWFLCQMNAFPVDRRKFDYRAINHAIKLIKGGNALGIFPEGTRSSDYTPKKGKGGICYIAKECKCDVVPVSLYTSDQAKPGTRLTVRYGEPIKYEELGFNEESHKMKDLRYASGLIMDRITQLWEKGHEN